MSSAELELAIIGIALVATGVTWLTLPRQGGRQEPGRGLSELMATCDFLGQQVGWRLDSQESQELFLTSYREKVRTQQLPESPEWSRRVFDEGRPLGPEAERARRVGITLWYLLGAHGQRKLQQAVGEYIYRLYDGDRRSTRGLRAELGPRPGLP